MRGTARSGAKGESKGKGKKTKFQLLLVTGPPDSVRAAYELTICAVERTLGRSLPSARRIQKLRVDLDGVDGQALDGQVPWATPPPSDSEAEAEEELRLGSEAQPAASSAGEAQPAAAPQLPSEMEVEPAVALEASLGADHTELAKPQESAVMPAEPLELRRPEPEPPGEAQPASAPTAEVYEGAGAPPASAAWSLELRVTPIPPPQTTSSVAWAAMEPSFVQVLRDLEAPLLPRANAPAPPVLSAQREASDAQPAPARQRAPSGAQSARVLRPAARSSETPRRRCARSWRRRGRRGPGTWTRSGTSCSRAPPSRGRTSATGCRRNGGLRW